MLALKVAIGRASVLVLIMTVDVWRLLHATAVPLALISLLGQTPILSSFLFLLLKSQWAHDEVDF